MQIAGGELSPTVLLSYKPCVNRTKRICLLVQQQHNYCLSSTQSFQIGFTVHSPGENSYKLRAKLVAGKVIDPNRKATAILLDRRDVCDLKLPSQHFKVHANRSLLLSTAIHRRKLPFTRDGIWKRHRTNDEDSEKEYCSGTVGQC